MPGALTDCENMPNNGQLALPSQKSSLSQVLLPTVLQRKKRSSAESDGVRI